MKFDFSSEIETVKGTVVDLEVVEVERYFVKC